jgi:hypothetical protein
MTRYTVGRLTQAASFRSRLHGCLNPCDAIGDLRDLARGVRTVDRPAKPLPVGRLRAKAGWSRHAEAFRQPETA